jgi:hypothetical protein
MTQLTNISRYVVLIQTRKEREVKEKKNFEVSWAKIGETSSSGDLVNRGVACSIADQGMYMNTFGMDNDRYKNSKHSSPNKLIASKAMNLDAADPDLNIYCSIEDVKTSRETKCHRSEVTKFPSEKESFGGQLSHIFHPCF